MESRTEMLARHQRELAELDSRWWEEWFTEDPSVSFTNHWHGKPGLNMEQWAKRVLPAIIRKREKVVIARADNLYTIGIGDKWISIPHSDAFYFAGRTLAPGEKVEV